MSEPIAQVDLEAEILRLSGLAEKVTHALAERGRECAEAESAYRSAYAHALLDAEGATVGEREAKATLATEEQYLDRKLAEAKVEAAKEAGRNYRAQLDALRAVNANLRSQVVGG